jgi:CheY-like chemotaxis protein
MARILLVEDDQAFAVMVCNWLTMQEHVVEPLHEGTQAVEQLKHAQYDVIVLDWDLPGVPGVDICRQYRDQGGTSPVLMLTGRGTVADKEQAFEIGADDYLVKPFHLKELSARIKALLRRSAPATAQAQPSRSGASEAMRNYCKICGGYFGADSPACPTDSAPLVPTPIKIDELVGTTIADRYIVMALIASGGMAVVYQAWHQFLNRLVAIKLLHTRFLDNPTHLRRFQLEAQSVSALNHPNIITMFDFGMIATQPYLVMEFINGPSLADALKHESLLPLDRAMRIFLQVCDGIEYAHANGIIHRDLKPSNLMLQQAANGEEIVRVVDFGIAKIIPQGDEEVERLTQTGEYFGTSYYMSPEQCMGLGLDARADIYSVGCIMYEVLTGRPPFVGDNTLDTLQKQIHEPAPSLSAARADLSVVPQLEKVVMKTLEKDARCRYYSMGELRQGLMEVYDQLAASRS